MDIKAKKKLLWAILFSTGFMFILISRVKWDHFSMITGKLNIKYLIAAYCVFLLGNIVRTFRFYKLDHMDKKLSHWWYISTFYNFITATLPGGAGEAATAYVLKRFSAFKTLSALRILLLSRLMDLFALSTLFFITSLLVHGDTSYRTAALWMSGALFLLSSVTLLRSSEQFIMRLLHTMPGHGKLIQKVREKISELTQISEEQRSNNSFSITLFQSVLMWIGAIVLTHLTLRSFGVDFSLLQSSYCFGVFAIFQMVPVHGIAGIGTQAAWWALALKVAGYNAPDSIALGFILYGIFYLFVAALGLFSLLFWFRGRERT